MKTGYWQAPGCSPGHAPEGSPHCVPVHLAPDFTFLAHSPLAGQVSYKYIYTSVDYGRVKKQSARPGSADCAVPGAGCPCSWLPGSGCACGAAGRRHWHSCGLGSPLKPQHSTTAWGRQEQPSTLRCAGPGTAIPRVCPQAWGPTLPQEGEETNAGGRPGGRKTLVTALLSSRTEEVLESGQGGLRVGSEKTGRLAWRACRPRGLWAGTSRGSCPARETGQGPTWR